MATKRKSSGKRASRVTAARQTKKKTSMRAPRTVAKTRKAKTTKAAGKKVVAKRKPVSKKTAVKKKAAAKKVQQAAPKVMPVAALKPKPVGEKPVRRPVSPVHEERERSLFDEEPKAVHEELAEDIELPEDIEEDMPEEVLLEDEEGEEGFLDKSEDLSGEDEDYHG